MTVRPHYSAGAYFLNKHRKKSKSISYEPKLCRTENKSKIYGVAIWNQMIRINCADLFDDKSLNLCDLFDWKLWKICFPRFVPSFLRPRPSFFKLFNPLSIPNALPFFYNIVNDFMIIKYKLKHFCAYLKFASASLVVNHCEICIDI